MLRSGLAAAEQQNRAGTGPPRVGQGVTEGCTSLSLCAGWRRVFRHDTLRGTLTRSVPSFITLREGQNMSNKSTLWFLLADVGRVTSSSVVREICPPPLFSRKPFEGPFGSSWRYTVVPLKTGLLRLNRTPAATRNTCKVEPSELCCETVQLWS